MTHEQFMNLAMEYMFLAVVGMLVIFTAVMLVSITLDIFGKKASR